MASYLLRLTIDDATDLLRSVVYTRIYVLARCDLHWVHDFTKIRVSVFFKNNTDVMNLISLNRYNHSPVCCPSHLVS